MAFKHLFRIALVLVVLLRWTMAPSAPLPRQLPASEPAAAQWPPASATELPGSAGAVTIDPPLPAADLPVYMPADLRDGLFQKAVFHGTWLALDEDRPESLGIGHLEGQVTVGLPLPSRDWPLLVTPTFGVYYLDGPETLDLPPRVYDAYVELIALWRIKPRCLLVLGAAPGVFSDFEQQSNDAVRIPLYGAVVYDWTPRLSIGVGAAYLDRDDVAVIPVAGFVWRPVDWWKFELVPPRPRVSLRIDGDFSGGTPSETWAYIAGEFGGGSWAIRRTDGADDVLHYRDFRVLLGVERDTLGGLDSRFEIGYVFGREIELAGLPAEIDSTDTVLLRIGLLY